MINVLVVDDSAVVRKILTQELSKFPDINVIGTAVDPYVAREKIVQLRPDVITLDLEMPRMDGLSFLAKLMKHFPMPVVVLSSLTRDKSEAALQALKLGAIEVLGKPGSSFSTQNISQRLAEAIRVAAKANVTQRVLPANVTTSLHSSGLTGLQTTYQVVAIGASTGGTKALESVLAPLPVSFPGTVVVQHMPEHFTRTFAQHLNESSQITVREAEDGDSIVPGQALIAPGNRHMVIERSGGTYRVKLKDGPRVHYQRPAVDVLFQSVAEQAGKNVVGVILTGMGADGAKGMKDMHDSGAYNIAQNEESCVVFGMPKEAIKAGGVDEVVALNDIPNAMIKALSKKQV